MFLQCEIAHQLSVDVVYDEDIRLLIKVDIILAVGVRVKEIRLVKFLDMSVNVGAVKNYTRSQVENDTSFVDFQETFWMTCSV